MALRKEASIWLSGKTVRKLMKDLDIRPIQRRKRRYNSYKKQTTQPEPNILNRNFHSSTICEKLVSDVTEFQVAGQRVYLSPLIDLFNKEVISHSISTSPTVSFVNAIFKDLDKKIPSNTTPIIHTDQGLQYWHQSYKAKLKELGAIQSMSRKANCQDNAVAESFFGHLKSEFFYRENFKTVKEFKIQLNNYIHWYNNDRIRCDLRGMSPVEYRHHYCQMAK